MSETFGIWRVFSREGAAASTVAVELEVGGDGEIELTTLGIILTPDQADKLADAVRTAAANARAAVKVRS